MLVKREVPKFTKLVGGNKVGKNIMDLDCLEFPGLSGKFVKGKDGVIRIDVIENVANIRYNQHCDMIIVNGDFNVM